VLDERQAAANGSFVILTALKRGSDDEIGAKAFFKHFLNVEQIQAAARKLLLLLWYENCLFVLVVWSRKKTWKNFMFMLQSFSAIHLRNKKLQPNARHYNCKKHCK